LSHLINNLNIIQLSKKNLLIVSVVSYYTPLKENESGWDC